MSSPRQRPGDGALLEDMRRALLAEFGAQAIYRHLAPRVDHAELREILIELGAAEAGQIERLRAVMSALGERPATQSRRRKLLAWALALASAVTGRRLVLRICAEAETTAARWYAQFAEYLAAVGELELARTCGELSSFKLRRANSLQPWLDLSRDQAL